jgi:DNA repair photolyase
MSLVQQMRGGKDYSAEFGTRMTGTGVFAQLIQQRFRKARARLGYGRLPDLDTTRFVPPRKPSPQGSLF